MAQADPGERVPRDGVRDDARGDRGAGRRARRRALTAPDAAVAVVVDDGVDELGARVVAALRGADVAVEFVPATELAAVPLDMDAHHAAVRGRRVGALFFRARPSAEFGGGFAERDASFSSSEAKAAWLAVMALPSVATVNRFTAETWFSFSEWPTWWRVMRVARIPVANVAVGDPEPPADARWLPWGGGVASVPHPRARRAFGAALVSAPELQPSVWCYGEVVDGVVTPSVRAIGAVFTAQDVNLAQITTTPDGRCVSCSAHPSLSPPAAAAASALIANALHAHLRRR